MAVRRLQSQGVAFDLKRVLLFPALPLQSALLGYVTRHHFGAFTCVEDARPEDEPFGGDLNTCAAFAQVLPRADGSAWDLAYLAPDLAAADQVLDRWLQLVSLLMILAAERGVQRLCARSPEDAPVEDALRQAGFSVLGREEVFCLRAPQNPSPCPPGLTSMSGRHRPAVAALYHQVHPRLHQQAESAPPCVVNDSYAHIALPGASTEYVWFRENRLVAYFGLTRSARGHWLDVMVRPEFRGELLPALKYVLAQTDCSEALPVFSAVPDHGVGLGWVLRTLGFESFARQSLLVAFPLARIPQRRPVMVSGLEGRVDVGTPLRGIRHCGAQEDPLEGHVTGDHR
jgi:hypothetical protein